MWAPLAWWIWWRVVLGLPDIDRPSADVPDSGRGRD